MSKLIIFCLAILLSGVFVFGQNLPLGMRYQAIARDVEGMLMSNEQMLARIEMITYDKAEKVVYTEFHQLKSNQFGLLNLTIGEGKQITGSYDGIPWSKQNVWVRISVKQITDDDFRIVTSSKLHSVTYAYYALEAGKLKNKSIEYKAGPGAGKVWSLVGNKKADLHSSPPLLGTTDDNPIVFITRNMERMRIAEDGTIDIKGDLNVEANAIIGMDLLVKQNVKLNTEGGTTEIDGPTTIGGPDMNPTTFTGPVQMDKTLDVDGATTLNSTLDVKNMAATKLTGTLDVDKATTLNSTLDVKNMAATNLTGTLDVDGATTLNSTLNVKNMAATKLTGTLDVGKNLTVVGATELNDLVSVNNRLDLVHSSKDFVATVENTNADDGDGIKIKLGKTHPRFMDSPPAPFSNEISAQIPGFTFLAAAVNSTKNLIKGLMVSPSTTFSGDNFVLIGQDMLAAFASELGVSDLTTYASLACNTTKDIIKDINGELNLPWNFPALSTPVIHVANSIQLFGGLDLGALGSIPSITVPAIDVPAANIINSFLAFPMITEPDCDAFPPLSDWSLPNFRLTSVPNSLTHENHYLQFTDKDDRQLGAVRAESITQWCDRYLSLTFFLNIFNSFAGVTVVGIDPSQLAETGVKYAINGLAQIVNVVDAYNSIGVEYSSGFGDYAEWLERAESSEEIYAGDIVSVKAGKISKDLSDAEQVMVVSYKPIVLGNTPPDEKAHLGNKVAFMGQIPVKIIGPVRSGDFIVGKGNVPGYGVAIHPTDMTVEDFARTVGRSWENMETPGAKLVNTVVGIHNGYSIDILKKYQQRLDETDARLSAIEDRLNLYMPMPQNNQ